MPLSAMVAGWRFRRPSPAVLVAVVVCLHAGCGDGSEPAADSSNTRDSIEISTDRSEPTDIDDTRGDNGARSDVGPLPASVDVFASYPRYLWHKRRLAIETTNHGTQPITITQLVLRAGHFEPLEPEAKATVIKPGSQVDLQVDFGELTSCETTEPMNAQVEMVLAVGDEDPQPLVGNLDTFPLDEMRRRECAARRVGDSLAIRFDTNPRITGDVLSGVVHLERVAGKEPITINRIAGSEVLAMQLQDGMTLPTFAPNDQTVDMPVNIVVKGCEPHLVGQSTRTYDLKVWVRIGNDADSQLVLIPLDPGFKDTLGAMIQDCIATRD